MIPSELSVFKRIPGAIFIDLEVNADGDVMELGVWSAATRERVRSSGVSALLGKIEQHMDEGSVLCGHNILAHDLPILAERYPRVIAMHKVPVIDSLILSPLAYPKNPYHSLVKDKALVSQMNDPLKDCIASAMVLSDSLDVFQANVDRQPDFIKLILSCLATGSLPEAGKRGIGTLHELFKLDALPIESEATWQLMAGLCSDRGCHNNLRDFWRTAHQSAAHRTAFAYFFAWLAVAGSDSVVPYWVSKQFSEVDAVVHGVRRQTCTDPGCPYCRQTHNPTEQLRRWFGFPAYRSEPALPGEPGRSLQDALVSAGMRNDSLLGILPTGGGKSLCFQIPALYRYSTTGSLTIVVSPLQSLMKDQVENLINRSAIHSSAALYGLLTYANRKVLLDQVTQGGVGLLYVSPEQFRSPSFRRAIMNRHVECWVFDEAHCLSKWGHDFRPDYLYVARFIRELVEEQGAPPPAVCCFTATAKLDVQQEIREHIKEQLGLDLRVYDGGAERDNLTYLVEEARGTGKDERIHDILVDKLGFPDGEGTGVVFCSTRKSTERMAEELRKRGWSAERFHAGLDADEKKRVFDSFMSGSARVIAATNAFGMGVDKPDIRVVIHAETPGSLESYLQEAGRAGRDGKQAECILLYDKNDLEKQFRLSGSSRVHLSEVQDIWRAIYKSRRTRDGEVVLTRSEIWRKAGEGDDEDPFGDMKVTTAVALLEKQDFLQRNENRPIVFQGRPLVKSIEDGRKIIKSLKLQPDTERLWLAYFGMFFSLSAGETHTLEGFVEHPLTEDARESYERGKHTRISPYRFVVNTLNEMADPALGLIRKGILFSALIRAGKRANASNDLRKMIEAEVALLKLLRELAPDAEGWLPCRIGQLNQQLCRAELLRCTPEVLVQFLQQWGQDPRQLQERSPNLEVKHSGKDFLNVRLLSTWQDVEQAMRVRHSHLDVLLKYLLSKVESADSEVWVEFSEHEISQAFEEDIALRSDPLRNVGNALLVLLDFAHRTHLLNLQNGRALISSAMTLKVNLEKTKGTRTAGFTKGDYAPLAAFYEERILQIHVMAEYARIASKKAARHVSMITDYFRLGKSEFAQRYLHEDQELYRTATSIESFRTIVDNLGNPTQQAIVASADKGNRIILAGPGSGKTRVITHRCAYLLRVQRLRPGNILVLCFNRNACLELRRRVYGLVDEDAHGVIISTYHGLALRLLGRSLVDMVKRRQENEDAFKELLIEATAWLREEIEVIGADPDNLRSNLMGDISHILIDEYQDVDEQEYAFIRALSGVDIKGDTRRPVLMAVGDDDQSIYGFKGANVRYIRKFCDDYDAQQSYLLENYRSTAHIINASNILIAANRDRMKVEYPIHINKSRAREPLGGGWESLDPLVRGRVHHISVADGVQQALVVAHRVQRLQSMDESLDPDQIAILSRQNNPLMPVRALFEERGVPFHHDVAGDDIPSLFRLRPVARWLRYLAEQNDEEWNGMVLRARFTDYMGDPADPWTLLLDSCLREIYGDIGERTKPVPELYGMFFDALNESKRQRALTPGIKLLTVHRAKGLEFKHVFLLDGGWECQPDKVEEERRVYYVGMTRARETLSLLHRTDLRSRFPREVEKTRGVFSQQAPEFSVAPDEYWMWRSYAMMSMEDLFISYAGTRPSRDPIHNALQCAREGDCLQIGTCGNGLGLFNQSGVTLARLSAAGVKKWTPKLDFIETIRIIAMVERNAEDGNADYDCKVPHWTVPLCEVVLAKQTVMAMPTPF